MTGDVHDRLVTGATLGEFGYECVPGIVHPTLDARALSGVAPGGLDRRHRARGVEVVCPSEREEVPIRLDPAETKDAPCRVLFECGLQRRVQRNGPAFSGFRLASAGRQEFLFEIRYEATSSS